MGVAHHLRPDRRPPQLTVVRHVLPEEGFRTWLTDLRHALAGRVSVCSVVDDLTVTVANLSAVSDINRLQRQAGGVVPESGIETLNALLAAEKPSVAARIRNPGAPLYVDNGELRVSFLLDPELLRRAASTALAGYCAEALGPEHKAFRPLDEIGELRLGSVQPALEGQVRVDAAAYRQSGFPSVGEFSGFCADPNEYLQASRAIAPPECLELGPMRVASTSPPPNYILTRPGGR